MILGSKILACIFCWLSILFQRIGGFKPPRGSQGCLLQTVLCLMPENKRRTHGCGPVWRSSPESPGKEKLPVQATEPVQGLRSRDSLMYQVTCWMDTSGAKLDGPIPRKQHLLSLLCDFDAIRTRGQRPCG